MRFYRFLLILFLPISTVFPAIWTLDANGNWNNNANWDVSFPDAVDATAEFFTAITGNRNVTLGQAITVGTINIDDNNTPECYLFFPLTLHK